MLSPKVDAYLRKIRRRCNVALVSRALGKTALWVLLFAGTFILFAKILGLPSTYYAVPLTAIAAIALAVAFFLARKSFFTTGDVLPEADNRFGLGGLLMTVAETRDETWTKEVGRRTAGRQPAPPRLRLGAHVARSLLCGAFMAATLFVPLRQPPHETAVSSAAAMTLKDVEEKVASLKQAKVIDSDAEQELEEQIEKLKEEISRGASAATWEAMNTLDEQIRQHATEVAEAAKWARSAVASVNSALAAGRSKTRPELGDDDPLAEQENKIREKCSGAGEGLTMSKKELAAALSRMRQLGATENLPESLKQCLGAHGVALPKDAQELQRFAKELEAYLLEKGKACNAMAGCCGVGGAEEKEDALPDLPGRGGITRGRGDAPMIFGDESDEAGASFTPQELPSTVVLNEDGMIVTEETAHRPDVKAEAGVTGPARKFGPTVGSPVWKRDLAPRHRKVIRTYFGEEE